MSVTETTEEAMRLLHQRRADHIARGRRTADFIITQFGTATTKDVYDALNALGAIDHTIPQHWLAAVFRNARYRWTGEMAFGKGHAGRGAKVWTFNDQ